MEKKTIDKPTCIDCRFIDLCGHSETQFLCEKHNVTINVLEESDDSIVLDTETCDDFEEARYVVSEKGLLSLILVDLNVCENVLDKRVGTLWELFVENMTKYGYYYKDEPKKEYPKTDKKPKDFMSSALKVVFGVTDEDVQDAVWTLFVKRMKELEFIKD